TQKYKDVSLGDAANVNEQMGNVPAGGDCNTGQNAADSLVVDLQVYDAGFIINNSKPNSKKTVSKNNGSSTVNKPNFCSSNGEEGESNTLGNTKEREVSKDNRDSDGIDVVMEMAAQSVMDNGTGDPGEKGMEQCNEQSCSRNNTKEYGSGKKEFSANRKSFVDAMSENLVHNDKKSAFLLRLMKMVLSFIMKKVKVVNSGPWMVNKKPLVVWKWSVDLKLNSIELDKVPPWVRLCNIPIKSWIMKGISEISSRIEKPLVMDVVTAKMDDNIEIVYKNNKGELQYKKNVKVMHNWKPLVCIDSRVFRHADNNCPKKELVKPIIVNSDKDDIVVQKEKSVTNANKESNDGFLEVRNIKNVRIDNKVKRRNFKANPQSNKVRNNVKSMYQAKSKNQVDKEKTNVNNPVKSLNKEEANKSSSDEENSEKSRKQWSVYKDILEAMKREENLQVFVVLETHIKSKKLDKVCEKLYGRWNWITNMRYCNKGCRIMVGWNEDEKAKVKWLSVGDINNAYFHKAIKSRQQRNRIDAVCDENGNIFKGSEVAEQFVMHFQKFLGDSKDVQKICSNEDANMIRKISDEEIKNAMFQIDNNKVHGPDGFSTHFFKKA
nr:RNA-directed DNA polymerase, eukaryota, reverse transcriptase zinc-binding domain protein [Tanacetum cinerariifolium]